MEVTMEATAQAAEAVMEAGVATREALEKAMEAAGAVTEGDSP